MNKRPVGFLGGFHAHFQNGAAIGAFGARVVTE